MDYAKESLRLHKEWKGKIEVVATVPVENKDEIQKHLPGVAIYDGGFGTAKQTRKRLTECGLLSGKESGGEVKIFNSKNTEDVLELSRRLLNL